MIKLILSLLFFGIMFTTCKSKSKQVSFPIKVSKNISDSIIQSYCNCVPDSEVLQPPYSFNKSLNPQEDSLYQIIESLPEVKNFNKRYNLKRLNKSIRIEISERPNKIFPYFWIQVGVIDKYRFQPVYNFYITKDNKQILYLDTANDDSLLTLKDWRRTRGW